MILKTFEKFLLNLEKYFWNWANIRFETTKVPILGNLGASTENIL